jgi:pectinesterase
MTSLVLAILLSTTTAPAATADAVVAADGSGNFKTVQEAVNAAPQLTSRDRPWTILIKAGTYRERVYVQREKRYITLRGDDADASKTVITYDLHANMPGPDGQKIGTFRTPTVYIDADDFSCENLTFENAAKRKVGQALAIRIDGDRVRFSNCRFLGWQDTILGNRGRHYFVDCYIAGAVDFIFGAATEWYENCHIHCLGSGYITAASTREDAPFGLVFNNCRITADSADVKTFLGRPWRAFASTIFLNTDLSAAIRPEGWHNWDKPEREQTARYAEFNSSGAGAALADKRVRWSRQLTADEAQAITKELVLSGTDGWKP